MKPPLEIPALGTVLAGKYRVDAVLGVGGMGVVLAATHAHLGEKVAIKLLQPAMAARPGARERFLREARVAMKLRGEHVVRILDVGMLADGAPYIAMEYLSGRDLGAVLGEDGPFAPAWAVDCVLQACEAIAEAHALGVVHRDLKPANLFLTSRVDGTPCVKVLDFGVSKVERAGLDLALTADGSGEFQPASHRAASLADTVQAADPGLTRTHAQLGSPRYMAPEQLRSSRDVDGRADIWALGVILHELLRGAPPFDGESLDELCAAVAERPAPRLEGVAAPLAAVVDRAMAKAPGDRFPNVPALADALAPFASNAGRSSAERITRLVRTMEAGKDGARASGVPASDGTSPFASGPPASRTLSASGSMPPRARSARRGVALAAVAVAVAVAGAAAWRLDPRSAPAPAKAASTVIPPHPPGFGAGDVRRVTFDRKCNQFPSLTPGERSVVFTADDGDDQHLIALDLASGARRRLTSEPGWQSGAAVSPDGTTVAYVTMHGEQHGAYVAPFDGSAPPRFLHAGYARPSWSPDGRSVWAGGAVVERVDFGTGVVSRRLSAPASTAVVLTRELPDGRVFAVLMDRKLHAMTRVVRFDPGKDDAVPVLDGTFEEVLAVAPDGAGILVSRVLPTQRAKLWVIPLDGAPPAPVPDSVVEPTKGLSIGPRLAVWSDCAANEGVVFLSRGADGGVLQPTPLDKTAWLEESPAGVPGDAEELVVVSDRRAKSELWVVGTKTKQARALDTGDLVPAEPAVSPDAKWVAFSVEGDGLYVVPVDSSRPARRVTHGSGDRSPTFGRDGATLYFETEGGRGARAIAAVARDGGAPRIVIARGAHPSASPTDDRVAYLAPVGDDLAEPRWWDAASGATRVVSREVRPDAYAYLRVSLDGARVAVATVGALAEVNALTGAVEARFSTGGEITGLGYTRDRVAIGFLERSGELWSIRVGAP